MQENNFSVPSRAAEQKGRQVTKTWLWRGEQVAGAGTSQVLCDCAQGSGGIRGWNAQAHWTPICLSSDNYRTRGTSNQWHSNPFQRRHQEPLLNRHKPEITYYRIHNKDTDGQEVIQLESYKLKANADGDSYSSSGNYRLSPGPSTCVGWVIQVNFWNNIANRNSRINHAFWWWAFKETHIPILHT